MELADGFCICRHVHMLVMSGTPHLLAAEDNKRSMESSATAPVEQHRWKLVRYLDSGETSALGLIYKRCISPLHVEIHPTLNEGPVWEHLWMSFAVLGARGVGELSLSP